MTETSSAPLGIGKFICRHQFRGEKGLKNKLGNTLGFPDQAFFG
jgi:hypothetical protein